RRLASLVTSVPHVETVSPHRPEPAAVERAIQAIKSGQLVILPTETVYGLVARADDPTVVERVRATKERPPTKPFARFAPSTRAVEAEIGTLPRSARLL